MEWTTEVMAYSIFCGAVGSAVMTFINNAISDRRTKKIAPILERDYGPKIAENFNRLEAAVKAGNRQDALVAVADRRTLLKELDTICSDYISNHASEKIRDTVAKGTGLEAYLNRVPPGDCCIP